MCDDERATTLYMVECNFDIIQHFQNGCAGFELPTMLVVVEGYLLPLVDQLKKKAIAVHHFSMSLWGCLSDGLVI